MPLLPADTGVGQSAVVTVVARPDEGADELPAVRREDRLRARSAAAAISASARAVVAGPGSQVVGQPSIAATGVTPTAAEPPRSQFAPA